MANKPTVYFVATELGEVHHGPAVYTRVLWELFKDSPLIDFHLIVLQSDTQHPRIHVPEQESGRRRGFYQRLAEHIERSVPSDRSSFLLHVNSAHLIGKKMATRFRTIVQINDTEVCQATVSLAQIKQYGLRRCLALQWRKMRERAVVADSELVICNSDFTTRTVRQSYNLSADKTIRVYKAVPLDPFLNESPEHHFVNGLQIIFIGNNWQRKGLEVLITAVAKICLMEPQLSIRLTVFGNPAATELNRFRQFTASLNISDKVDFAGVLSRDVAAKRIAGSTVLALPSFEEALGLVAIEAIATGIPVVGSEVGGIPEIINDTRLGTLVETGNPEALANAIRGQYHGSSSPQLTAYRKDSSKRFSTTSLTRVIESLYLNQF